MSVLAGLKHGQCQLSHVKKYFTHISLVLALYLGYSSEEEDAILSSCSVTSFQTCHSSSFGGILLLDSLPQIIFF